MTTDVKTRSLARVLARVTKIPLYITNFHNDFELTYISIILSLCKSIKLPKFSCRGHPEYFCKAFPFACNRNQESPVLQTVLGYKFLDIVDFDCSSIFVKLMERGIFHLEKPNFFYDVIKHGGVTSF